MTKRKGLQWWIIPSIATATIAALGGLGTLAMNYATFATLPQRVEAGEATNKQQDESLIGLSKIAEQNQKLLDKWDGIYQQQQQRQSLSHHPVEQTAQPLRELDADGYAWCCETTQQECWERATWYVCE